MPDGFFRCPPLRTISRRSCITALTHRDRGGERMPQEPFKLAGSEIRHATKFAHSTRLRTPMIILSPPMSTDELNIIEPGGDLYFPPVDQAIGAGILAIGGDLSIPRMLAAYEHGIFPWYMPDDPIIWWAPVERCILRHHQLKVTKSLRSSIRNKGYEVRIDTDFAGVLEGCGDREETWLTEEVKVAFQALHEFGFAHSFETWCEGELVGGLFGVSIGRQFTGDSMFSRATDASKVALTYLIDFARQHGFSPIDCQIENEHLTSLGAEVVQRSDFMDELAMWVAKAPSLRGKWTDLAPSTWPLYQR